MNVLHLRLTVFYLIFLQVFDVSCFDLGGSIETPETPLDPPQVDCRTMQGSQKVPFSPLQQLNFIMGQVKFPYHMFNGQVLTVMFPSQVE